VSGATHWGAAPRQVQTPPVIRLLGGLLTSLVPAPAAGSGRGTRVHVHRFRRVADDPFSSASLYSCGCGESRAAF
jgi:hypothetical protein